MNFVTGDFFPIWFQFASLTNGYLFKRNKKQKNTKNNYEGMGDYEGLNTHETLNLGKRESMVNLHLAKSESE